MSSTVSRSDIQGKHHPLDTESSISTCITLPSLLTSKPHISLTDFSASVPIFHGRSGDIWGSDSIPALPKYKSVFDDIDKDDEEKGSDSDKDSDYHTEQIDESKNRRRSTANKVRRSSLLGMGYQYNSEKDLMKVVSKTPKILKPPKKISKHSRNIFL